MPVPPPSEELISGSQARMNVSLPKAINAKEEKVQTVAFGAKTLVSAMLDVYSQQHPHKIALLAKPLSLDSIIDRLPSLELPEDIPLEMAHKLPSYADLIVKLAADKAGGSKVKLAHDTTDLFFIGDKVFINCKGETRADKIAKLVEQLESDSTLPEEIHAIFLSGNIEIISDRDIELIETKSDNLANEFRTTMDKVEELEVKKTEGIESQGVEGVPFKATAAIEKISIHILATYIRETQAHTRHRTEKEGQRLRFQQKAEQKEDISHKTKDFEHYLNDHLEQIKEQLSSIEHSLEKELEERSSEERSRKEEDIEREGDIKEFGHVGPF